MRGHGDERTLWLLVGAAGALAIVVGAFLPLWDPGSVVFARIQGNSVLQSGTGWVSLAVAVIALISIVRAFYFPRRTWAPCIFGLIALVYAVYNGTNRGVRTLCPSTARSMSAPSCQLAQPGLGVYAMAIGAIALLTAGLYLLRQPRLEQPASRECPFCKEPMRRDAST